MLCIKLQDLKKKISKKMETSALTPKVLQSRFKLWVDRPVALFNDYTYMPFYYHLGKYLGATKNLIEFGFDLGLPSGCFLEGCPGVEHFLAFRKKNNYFYSKRLGVSNIHNIWKKKFEFWLGNESDPELIKSILLRKWDCAIISDDNQQEKTYRAYLDLIWNQMNEGGLVVLDYLGTSAAMEAYKSFCKIQSREPFYVNTLRGTGILQK
jgi:hypothetical protein